jgi:hypothetical protein
MSYRAARPGTPRMPDAPIAQAGPMPKRANLSLADQIADLDPRSPDYWWQRIITIMRAPEGRHLLICQREFATRAWINAGRPAQWAPPGYQDRLDITAPETDEDLPPV